MRLSIRCRMVKKEIAKLAKQDWIERGLKVLAEQGIEAVRVEPLAKLLHVTKGSFYWHFKNRDDLLAALLQEWVSRETDRIIEQTEAGGGDANQKLLRLLELAVRDNGQVENAVRGWATSDARVAAILAEVDQRRLDYTQTLFLQVGFTPFEAIVRARMAYYSLIGEFTIGTARSLEERLAEARLRHAILTHHD
jgi:AcrR family transcriptional regulator